MYDFIVRVSIGAVFCVLARPDAVRADIAPLPSITSVEQEGQDVKITLWRKASTIDAFGVDEFALIRTQSDASPKVIADGGLGFDQVSLREPGCGDSTYNPISIESFCDTYPDDCLSCGGESENSVCIGEDCSTCGPLDTPYCCEKWDGGDAAFCAEFFCPKDINASLDFCDKYPLYRVDCDEDSAAECCLSCDDDLYFDFWDRCVPPGATEYSIEGGDSVSIGVLNTEDTCLQNLSTDEPSATDAPAATDEPAATEEQTETETIPTTDEPVTSDSAADPHKPIDVNGLDSDDIESDENKDSNDAVSSSSGGCRMISTGTLSVQPNVLSLIEILFIGNRDDDLR